MPIFTKQFHLKVKFVRTYSRPAGWYYKQLGFIAEAPERGQLDFLRKMFGRVIQRRSWPGVFTLILSFLQDHVPSRLKVATVKMDPAVFFHSYTAVKWWTIAQPHIMVVRIKHLGAVQQSIMIGTKNGDSVLVGRWIDFIWVSVWW